MKRVLAVLAAAFLLTSGVLTACGDDDGGGALGGGSGDGASSSDGGDLSAEEQALVDDLKSDFTDDTEGFSLPDDEADCAARGMLDAVGIDRAKELNESDDSELRLTKDEAEKVASAMVGCADLRPLFVSSFVSEGDISNDSAKCLADSITDDQIEALLVAEFSGSDDTSAQTDMTRTVTAAMSECLTDEELSAIGGE